MFLEETTAVFENRIVSIPKMWDQYLQWVYGDFMKLPPEDKRVPHHYVYEVRY